MGLFDSVMVPCPACGERAAFQTKSGPCLMRTYDLETAPFDVMENVNRHAPSECQKCKTLFEVGPNGLSVEVER